MMDQCNYCNKLIDTPWIEYINNKNEHCKLCSYLCNKKLDCKYNWEDVINKDDFKEYMLFPTYVTNNKESFNVLSKKELNKLSKNDINNYYKRLEEFKLYESDRYDIISSIMDDIDYMDDYEDYLIDNSDDDTNNIDDY